MNTQIRAQSLALGLGALMTAGLPAMALAQPYDPNAYNGGYSQERYDQQRREYDDQYGPGAYDRDMADQQADQQRAREACRQQKQENQAVGGVLGGIAGAVIGSNVARGGGREGGAVIGGVGGAVAGSQIAKSQTNCG